ncbi:Carnitine/acyl carnitine carrier [Balamuthia mandrillaris]
MREVPVPEFAPQERAADDVAHVAVVGTRRRAKEFVCGSLSGMAGIIVGHPLDTIKVLLQTQTSSGASAALPARTSALQCFLHTVRSQGPLGLFKGLTPPLTGVSITNATAFSGYGAMRRVVMGREALPAEMTLPQVMLAGAGTGILSGLVTAPIDVVKTQLQVQALSSSPSSSASSAGNAASLEASRGGSVHYAGPIDCIRRVGLRGMFIGLSATWIRDIVGFGIYFSCYELVRRALLEKDFSALQHNDTFALKKLSLPQQLLAGSVVGLCSGVITQPLDVIKSRIQGQVLHFSSSSSSSLWLFRPPPERTMYKGFLDCARQSNKEGARQVYLKGFGPALGRAIPVTATILLVYEYLIQVLPE